jgi:hypothetical protein
MDKPNFKKLCKTENWNARMSCSSKPAKIYCKDDDIDPYLNLEKVNIYNGWKVTYWNKYGAITPKNCGFLKQNIILNKDSR